MTTQLFLSVETSVAADFTHGLQYTNLAGSAVSWAGVRLLTTRGSFTNSVTASSVTGPTSGVECISSSRVQVFISAPLAADVTISGTITFNLWSFESNMSANGAVNALVFRAPSDGSAWVQIVQTARTTELGTSSAVANFTATPTSTACNKGDRLVVIPFFDDAGTMASGFTFTLRYNGTTAAADGDSYVTFNETFSVSEGTPTGTTIYPTTTSAGINPGSATESEAWTSRGAGVTTAITNSVAGPTSAIQITDTAGGTMLEWYTKPLTAMTLSGPVLVNLRGLQSTAGVRGNYRVEIAATASDGSSATVWGTGSGGGGSLFGTTETVVQFYVSGDDLALANGDRLRLRILFDDGYGTAVVDPQTMATGGTGTVYYAGTSGGASGDTYLTFTDTLTEFVRASLLIPHRHRALIVR